MSQVDLGNATGISNRVISLYEKDDREPLISAAFSIAKVLEVSLDYLMGDETSSLIDKSLIKKLNKLEQLPETEREAVLLVLDKFLK